MCFNVLFTSPHRQEEDEDTNARTSPPPAEPPRQLSPRASPTGVLALPPSRPPPTLPRPPPPSTIPGAARGPAPPSPFAGLSAQDLVDCMTSGRAEAVEEFLVRHTHARVFRIMLCVSATCGSFKPVEKDISLLISFLYVRHPFPPRSSSFCALRLIFSLSSRWKAERFSPLPLPSTQVPCRSQQMRTKKVWAPRT